MKIISVEPTPSPNSMKFNLDYSLATGEKFTFTKDNPAGAPEQMQKILLINGVKSIYHVANFMAVDRFPNADWKDILDEIQTIFGENVISKNEVNNAEAIPAFGEVKVLVQTLRGIPSQVKLFFGNEEARFGLPERFIKAVMHVQSYTTNYIYERQWDEHGVRYGEVQEIGEEVVSEIAAAYDEERLNQLVELALRQEHGTEQHLSTEVVSEQMAHPNWEKRFAALERLQPTLADLPILQTALNDSSTSIRRLATVYLGMIGGKEVLPHFFNVVKDKSSVIRRTAGDVISDLGDADAIPAMVEVLKDTNKLVRWRAARFLFEVGDETALDALEKAQGDPEFEVDLQIRMAIERIASGEEASGTVWQQMTREMKK